MSGFKDYTGQDYMASFPFPDMQSGLYPEAHQTTYTIKTNKRLLYTHACLQALLNVEGIFMLLNTGPLTQHIMVPEVLAGQNMPPFVYQSMCHPQL